MVVLVKDTDFIPRISVVYSDKTILNLKTSNRTCQEIYDDINRHAKKLKLEQDIKNAAS
jgi:hypothetical protein